MKPCKTCEGLTANKVYCSNICKYKDRTKKIKIECQNCSIIFLVQPRYKKRMYCSSKCRGVASKKPKETVICDNCGKQYDINKKEFGNRKAIQKWFYCSRTCKDKHQSVIFKGNLNPNYDHHALKGRHRVFTLTHKQNIKNSWEDPQRREKYYIYVQRYFDKFGFLPFQNINRGKAGKYFSNKTNLQEYYDSSWELERMKQLDSDDSVFFWSKRHGIRLPYVYLNKKHNYFPDFLIIYNDGRKILEEVKGYIRNLEEFDLKNQAAINFCIEHNIFYQINRNFKWLKLK